MKIRAVEIKRVRIPLSEPYVFGPNLEGHSHYRKPVDYFENIVIRMKGEEGLEGIGECVVRSTISSIDLAEKTLESEFVPAIIGMDSMDVEAIIKKLDPQKRPDLGPVAGIDLALWDLNGKQLGLPAYKLLGGAVQDSLPASYTLSMASPDKMAEKTLEMANYGYKTFVVKVGQGTVQEDIDRVRIVREAAGSGIKLRLDANSAWTVENAIPVLQAAESYDVEYIEQPIPPGDLEGLKRIAASTRVPICVDESLQYLSDAVELIRSGAVGLFNIKVPQCGGLWLSKKIAAVAESAGIPCICGGRLALEIVRQASRHFVASTPQACTGYAHEGPGPASQAVTASVTKTTLNYNDVKAGNGCVQLSQKPGLGVDLDNTLLDRYAA
ncbi:MAG: mandelate racemase/muconate lactonizing enzyme family protein [Deltaproteobacteria bacterium]|nr:mandelate racemase/muconate lactonizing enzyme family protein [Deltaproteobacteria bacterium]